MNRRQSIAVPGLHHGGVPIPTASRVGGLLMSSGVAGLDPESGDVPESVEAQVAVIFANVRRIAEAAGGSVEDIVKITFFARDRGASRPHIDREWLQMFPDEHSRPARHTLAYALPDPMLVQAEFVAVVQEITQ
jgi:enamine deaminase RidA (YjgF/YER057c/UK114 family)